jgi:homoserine dehydrogenase
VIKDAKGKGFTEPDPRDDLSGTDVARKVRCLVITPSAAAFSAPTSQGTASYW